MTGSSMPPASHSTALLTLNATQKKVRLAFSLLFLAAFLLSGPRFSEAQTGAAISGQAVTPTGTPAYNAQLYACAYNATGIPCYPQVPIYNNSALSGSPITQPTSTNQWGTYNFWVANGTTVLVQIKINGTVTYSFYQTAGGSGGGGGCITSGAVGAFQAADGSGGCEALDAQYSANTFTFGVSSAHTFTVNGSTVNLNSTSPSTLLANGSPICTPGDGLCPSVIVQVNNLAISPPTPANFVNSPTITAAASGNQISFTALPQIQALQYNYVQQGTGQYVLVPFTVNAASGTDPTCSSAGSVNGAIGPPTTFGGAGFFISGGCDGTATFTVPQLPPGVTVGQITNIYAGAFKSQTNYGNAQPSETTHIAFAISGGGGCLPVRNGSTGGMSPTPFQYGCHIAGSAANFSTITATATGATNPFGGGGGLSYVAFLEVDYTGTPVVQTGAINLGPGFGWDATTNTLSNRTFALYPLTISSLQGLTSGPLEQPANTYNLVLDAVSATTGPCTGSGGGSFQGWCVANGNGGFAFVPLGGSGGTGVTSVTGDGSLITNLSSTGAVTLTLGTAGAHKWWGNNTGSTAAPGYESLTAADIPTLNQNTTGYAAGLAGGALGSVPYQTAANATAFLASPTTNGHAFVLGWNTSTGSATAPSIYDLGTYLGTNITATSPLSISTTTLGITISCATCPSSATGTTVSVNGGSTLGSLNINATSPTADSSFLALTPKISGANMIIEAPYATGSSFGVAECGTGTTCTGGVISVALTPPGGSANQIQFNSGGTAFGGFTMSGDCTIVVGTGVITCLDSNGTPFGTAAFATLGNTGSDVPQLTSGLLNNSVINWASPGALGSGTPNSAIFSALRDTAITGSTQCVQAGSTGVLAGAGFGCINYPSAGMYVSSLATTTGTGWDTPISALNPVFSGVVTGQGGVYAYTGSTATSGTNYNSPSVEWVGSAWTGSGGTNVTWYATNALGTGVNPTTTLTFTSSGSSGAQTVSFPSIQAATFTSTSSTHGIIIPAGTAVAGSAGNFVLSSDATNGYCEANENNTGASRCLTAANFSSVIGSPALLGSANAFTAANTFSGGVQLTYGAPASTSAVYDTGAPPTGGTGTTNWPQWYINGDTGHVSTWIAAGGGTVFGINETTAFQSGGGEFLQFNVAGVSVFDVDAGGNMTLDDINATNYIAAPSLLATGGTNSHVYRCATAGALPVGALTINTASCGSTVDTGYKVK